MAIHFRRQFISAETFEAAGVWDVDGDGRLDIVSGGFWHKGPTFLEKFPICEVAQFGEYYDDFSAIPFDVDGDGRLDVVTGGWWGGSLRWRQCPSDPTQPWREHVLAEGIGNVETTRAWDVDGDGELEIVPNTPGHPFAYYKRIPGTTNFSKHLVSETPIGHGFGFGDVDGDGVGEFVFGKGIIKRIGSSWQTLPLFDLGFPDASCPILVVDANRDGVADLIVGHAHSYGLEWWEQRSTGAWLRHPIDEDNAQYHDLQWADIDGDGQPELVTGKRHRAHCGNDAGEADALGIYYFKWNGESFTKQVIDYQPPGGDGGGCGIQFALADLRGVGRLDLVAPGKDGLYVYWNEAGGS
jgi:hypothetical protein